MQATENFSTDRRAPDFEDFIDIVRRHKSWILAPLYAGIVISTVVAFLWPDTYVSSALIRVTSSQVPEKFVASNVNQLLTDRIQAIAEGVKSRSTLTNIIQTYDLYPRERRRLPLEDIIERMRAKDIQIGGVNLLQGQQRVGAFSIAFRYENRYLAKKVADDIVSRLINENERETISISQQTTDFLTTEVGKAKQKLDEIEQKMTEFRMRNAGNLPEEQQTNFQAMNSLDQRLGQLNGSVGRVNQDKLLMESNLRVSREQLAKAIEAATVTGNGDPVRMQAKNEQLAQKEREIAGVEAVLLQLKSQYTDINPDVIRVEGNLRSLRSQRDELARAEEQARKATAAAEVKTPPQRRLVMTREIQTMEGNIKQYESMIQAKNMEMQDLNAELGRLNTQIRNFQGRITSSPLANQLYVQLTRDYEQAKQVYNSMAGKQGESERGTAIIRNKQGETLELLDQAQLPVNPSEPRREQIIGAGAAIGLLLGLMLVGVREMKDTTLKNLKDVRAYTQLTVLGCVPLLEDDIVMKRRKRLALLGWSTGLLVGVLVMGGAVAYYFMANS